MSKHNKDNEPQERFNQIKSYCDNWIWQKNSVVRFGGSWNDTSHSSSRASIWITTPSDYGNSLSARGVCDHKIFINSSQGEL